MAPHIRIDVTSERHQYPVLIGPGLSTRLPELLETHQLDGTPLVVSCAPVWRLHGARVRALVGRGRKPALMADGERAKQLRTVSTLYEACLRNGLDRAGLVVAFGGGVVGDAAGFAAATFLRGVRLVQVPTTLLSQVDSAIGGKVGVNLPGGKNLVGAFHPPAMVVCDPDVLTTLPRREFRAGLYEVVKYGVLGSRPLFDAIGAQLDAILACDAAVLTPLIADCCRIKAHVVTIDEREQGPRRALNFGHTVGHALESLTHYRRFRHGEAIGHGMLAAAHLSVQRGTMSEADASLMDDLIRKLGRLPLVTDLSAKAALKVIAHDKKVVRGRLHYVLAKGLGDTEIAKDVTPDELVDAMRAIGMRR